MSQVDRFSRDGWGLDGFPDPFQDIATHAMPYSAAAMLRYAEYFALTQETFREALRRTAAYFITDLELSGEADEKERKEYKSYLLDDAGLIEFLYEGAECFLTYGNGYFSAHRPFVRFLTCPRPGCAARYRFDVFARERRYDFRWQGAFHGRCPACGYRGDFGRPWDPPDRDTPVVLKVWNPHDMRPHYDEYTGHVVAFDWIIPAEYRGDVKQGKVEALARAPWPVLQAIQRNQDFRFAPDYIHHWRDRTLSGVRTRGMGIPRAIVNFRILYYLQILRRFNESLAAAHVTPFRVVSPLPAGRDGEAGDIIKTTSLLNLQAHFRRLLATHRRDPNAWHYSPVPLNYQALGADARQLAPKDLIDQGYDTLLNGCGVPVDLYKMTLQTQVAPVGLRLFQRFQAPLVGGLNRLVNFAVGKVVAYKGWAPVTGKLTDVDLVDQIENQQLKAQMTQAGWLSRTEALKAVKADFEEQTNKKLDEQRIEAEAQADFDRQMEQMGLGQQLAQATDPTQPQQQQPGAAGGPAGDPSQTQQPGQPGQPGAPGGVAAAGQPNPQDLLQLVPPQNQPIDPVDLQQRAQSIARALLSPQLDDTQRTSLLYQIRKANEQFQAVVRQEMDKLRNQAESMGRGPALAQLTQGQ